MLNDTLIASAARLYRVRKELLLSSDLRRAAAVRIARCRLSVPLTLPRAAVVTSLLPLARLAASASGYHAVAYAALRAQIRREFEEHMKRNNRPVTVMTSAGLVTLSFTEVQGNDAWLCEQPILGLLKRKISQQPHLHDGR
ncbi:hypothetical protein D6D00_07217 [Aureobasidium pullulans]|nr:hypothetical protein D6D00_07217 [Aureobasidium pullulans]